MSIPDGAEYWWDVRGYGKCYESREPKKMKRFSVIYPDGAQRTGLQRRHLVIILQKIFRDQSGCHIPRSRFKEIQWTRIVKMLEDRGYKIEVVIK